LIIMRRLSGGQRLFYGGFWLIGDCASFRGFPARSRRVGMQGHMKENENVENRLRWDIIVGRKVDVTRKQWRKNCAA